MGKSRKTYEKTRFMDVVITYIRTHHEYPPIPEGVFKAIMDFHR